MFAADSNVTGCINRILDDCDELQQNDTYGNDLNNNDSSNEVDGGSGALSMATKDNDGNKVLCTAIRNGKR